MDLSEYQGSNRSEKLNNLRFTFGAITKFPEWAYEKEWRYVVHKYPSDEPFFQITPKPTAIYLGAKFDENYRKDILDIAENRGIKVYEMKMKIDKFILEQHEIFSN